MIVFDLRCLGAGHVFEGWFGSSADYEGQRARGLVQCPVCGVGEIEKAVMAPRLAAKANRTGEATAVAAYSDPDSVKAMMAAMAAAQKAMLANSAYVGDRFPDAVRAIYLGEAEGRSIHGKATRAETASLIEEGIRIAALPFPVIQPGEEN